MKGKILIISLFLCILLCGCKNENEQPPINDEGEAVLSVAIDKNSYSDEQMWEQIAENFEKLYDNIDVQINISSELETELKDTKAMPDVVLLGLGQGDGLTAEFLRDGKIEDISDMSKMLIPSEGSVLENKIKSEFLINPYTVPFDDGKTYFMPMFYDPYLLFYNPAVFEDEGFSVPSAWGHLWELAQKCEEKNMSLFTYAESLDPYLYILLCCQGGDTLFNAVTNYEQGSWATEQITTLCSIVTSVAGYTHPDTFTNLTQGTPAENIQMIIDGDALIMPSSASEIINFSGNLPEGYIWGISAFPSLANIEEKYAYASFEQIWIPTDAKNKDYAKEFIAYLYSDAAVKIFAKEANAIQPVEDVMDYVDGYTEFIYSVYENVKHIIGGFHITEKETSVIMQDVFAGVFPILASGQKDHEQWSYELIEANDIIISEIA